MLSRECDVKGPVVVFGGGFFFFSLGGEPHRSANGVSIQKRQFF